jgi:hypothetical protein
VPALFQFPDHPRSVPRADAVFIDRAQLPSLEATMRERGGRAVLVLAVVAAAAAVSGCLVKETDTTITIRPDGSGTWTIVDRDIRSAADTPADRLREETEFLENVHTGRYEPAVALDEIGCSEASTQMTRREWPYAATTECRFSDVGAVWQQVLDRSGLRGESSVETAGDRTTWRMWVDTSGDAKVETTDHEAPADVLLSGNKPRWFLLHGRFIEATGFDVSDDGAVATMKAISGDEQQATNGVIEFALTWKVTDR